MRNFTFSYLGMASQTIAVGDKKIINVTLKEKEDMLEEVTIVALWKAKKGECNLLHSDSTCQRPESSLQ